MADLCLAFEKELEIILETKLRKLKSLIMSPFLHFCYLRYLRIKNLLKDGFVFLILFNVYVCSLILFNCLICWKIMTRRNTEMPLSFGFSLCPSCYLISENGEIVN